MNQTGINLDHQRVKTCDMKPPETRRHSTLQKQLQCVSASRERLSDERNFCLLTESLSLNRLNVRQQTLSRCSFSLNSAWHKNLFRIHSLLSVTVCIDVESRPNVMSVGLIMCILPCVSGVTVRYLCVHVCVCTFCRLECVGVSPLILFMNTIV